MQTIQIDGTYTYIDNIRKLRIGDKIKLKQNPFNRINKDSVGAYTLSGSKIGYIPFKSSQININGTYIVSKINLTQHNPILLITIDFPQFNTIHCEPICMKNIKIKNFDNNNIIIKNELKSDINNFIKFLEKEGHIIQNIKVCELTDLFITLLIETPETTNYFFTINKSYYENNIFKYDEFYKFGLIPKCIYEPFKIHRLEEYLIFNYSLLLKKKIKYKQIVELGIFNLFDLDDPTTFFKKINLPKIIKEIQIPKSLNVKYHELWLKLLIKYNINPMEFYNPNILSPESNILLNLHDLNIFANDIEPCGISYNHNLKSYCEVDLIDSQSIFDIKICDKISQSYFTELIVKILITNKKIINIFNPLKMILFTLEINDINKKKIYKLIEK
jgi:hypothetical protein